MKSKFSHLILFGLLISFPQPGITHASDKPEELPAVEVSATRLETTPEKYAGSMTVITQKQIKESGYPQVENLLREQLGIDVHRQGGAGTESLVRMRGTDSKGTLVIIDGMRVNGNTSGDFNFHDLNTESIERIEILRGPQSTVWGADAVGGVINIITRKGRGAPKHSVTFEGGSYDSFKESLQSSGTLENYDYSATASRTDIGGFSSFKNDEQLSFEDDAFENTYLSTRLGRDFANNGRVEIIGHFSRSYVDVDTTTGDRLFRDTESERGHIAIPVKFEVTDWWKVKLNPNMSYDELRSDAETDASTSDIFNRTYVIDFQNNLSLNDYLSAVMGMEYRVQDGHNNRNGLDSTTYNQGYFFQGQFDWEDRVLLTAGFRQDINSVFEDKVTYRTEGAYRFLSTGTRLHAAYATGFRAPSFNELFFTAPPGPGGNPNLQPEETESWEVGVDQSFLQDRVRFGLTYFDTVFENLITFTGTSATDTFINVSDSTVQGLESSVEVDLPFDLTFGGNYTWTEAVDSETRRPLRRIAKNKFTATLTHTWHDKLISLISVTGRSGVVDDSSATRTTQGYVIARAALRYKYNQNLELFTRGENLLDKTYSEVERRGTPGVAGYAGFTYTFR